MLEKIFKMIARHIHGTGAHVAKKKRALETELRKQGFSRKQALDMTNKYFILK